MNLRSHFLCVPILAALLATSTGAHARTWHVTVNGTGDAPTIQAAVDSAADGDIVLVAAGNYNWGNQGGTIAGMIFIPETGPNLTIISESGPEVTILDAQLQGRVLAHQGETSLTLEGFTITRGISTSWGEDFGGGVLTHKASTIVRNCIFTYNHARMGGGLWYGGFGTVTVEDCVFEHNTADQGGGAVFLINSPFATTVSIIRSSVMRNNSVLSGSVTGGGAIGSYNIRFEVEDCLLIGNEAAAAGGAIDNSNGGPNVVRGCTVVQNSAQNGGGISSTGSGVLTVENCIVTENDGNDPVFADGTSSVDVTCTDIYGNYPGDWTGHVAGQLGINGNFSQDPIFCTSSAKPFGLKKSSPCAPGKHPDGYGCGLIGAFPVVCGAAIPIAVQEKSWGAIKTLYRD